MWALTGAYEIYIKKMGHLSPKSKLYLNSYTMGTKARGPFQQRLPHSSSGKLTERWRAERGLLWTIRRSLIELQTFHQQPHCITPATLQLCNLCDRESKIQKFGFTIVLCSHNRHNRENPNLSNKIIRSSHSVIM